MKLSGLLKFILLALPFTNSVTLPVGFPLKAYEGVGFLALFLVLTSSGAISLGRNQRFPLLWGIFFFGSLVASGWGINELLVSDLTMLEWAHGRYNPLINTLFHFTYLGFDIGLLVLFLHALNTGLLSLLDFCRFWLYGALISVIYAVALNLVLVAGFPASLLLRWDKVQYMDVLGVSMARTGPFEEGNYFGLYLLVSTVIALWAGRHWSTRFFRLMLPVLMAGAVITASPAALLGVMVVIFVAVISGGVAPVVRYLAATGGVVVMGILIQTGLFKTLVLDKFSLLFVGGVTDTQNVSLIQRLNESYHAWQMFLDHPLGVGMGNFGYFFGRYPDLYTWLVTDFNNFKPIANNVYLEVLSEHGLFMFLLFLFVLYLMIRRLVRAREFMVAAGMLLLCVYFVAFPTFRLSLIWVFWAWVIFIGSDQTDRRKRNNGQAAASK